MTKCIDNIIHKRNVYDFDGTIYDGDSTIDLYIYCLKKNKKIIKYIPTFIFELVKYKLHYIEKTELKQEFYKFLLESYLNESKLEESWNINSRKIKSWYINQKRDTDVIVTASPEFLIRSIMNNLGIHCIIGSKVDMKTGKYHGKNCSGKEKVTRIYYEIHGIEIDKFYSDSYSDKPMAKIANKSYLVHKNVIKKWIL